MKHRYIPELNELADKALNIILPESDGKAIVTRGVVIMEILLPDQEHRGVIGLDIGRQGELSPWDVVGLLTPVRLRAESLMTEWMWRADDETSPH